MARIGKDEKQPIEIESFDVDFSEYLREGDGLDVVAAVVRVLSGPATTPMKVDKIENTTLLSKVWLSGGVDGASYRVEVTADTQGGRRKQVEFDIKVKEV